MIVSVMVNASPDALIVAVVVKRVSNIIVPDELALNTPILAMVTASESDPFAVNVLVKVYVEVPFEWAGVAWARIRPPPPVVISAVSVVSPAAGADAFAVSAM